MTSGEMIFDIENPISVSRPVYTSPEVSMTGAFFLPNFNQESFAIEGFIGDIEQGGSCNVRIQSFTPHNLTHLESSLHVVKNGHPISSFSSKELQGIAYVIDLTALPITENNLIKVEDIDNIIQDLDETVKFLALKTKYSQIDIHKDFSNTSPIAIDPKLAKYLSENLPNIIGLFLDLPSADIENDGGRLLAHRNFFEISPEGINSVKHPKKFISELGYFDKLSSGYYYCICTPPRIETDSVITDILFYPQKD